MNSLAPTVEEDTVSQRSILEAGTMDYVSTVKAGFDSELSKIAGFLRSGKRPFKATTLLSKTPSAPKAKSAEMLKISAKTPASLKGKALRYGAVAGLGMLGYDQAKKAKNDWQMGRQMRKQQGY